MELRYGWETMLRGWEVVLFAAFAVVFPLAGLVVVGGAPGEVKPVLVALLFGVPFGALGLWLQRTGRWRRHARVVGGSDGVTLVDSGGRRVSISRDHLDVQRLAVWAGQTEDGVVVGQRRFVVLEDWSTGDCWALAEMAWPAGQRFWQELGIEPRTAGAVDSRKGLRLRFPNVRHFGSADVGYSALGWLGLSFVSTMAVSGLATLL